jgi:S1-C subfamily serine protease
MTAIEELGTALRTTAERVGPAVVSVGNGWRGGSGVVLGEGLILTNAHNLHGDAVTVTLGDGRDVEGRIGGVDVEGDIAVVHAETGGAAAIAWSDATPDVGSPVFALSRPRGLGLRATFGFVSGTARTFRGPRGHRIAGSIEHTAPLAPGSSGGPTVDAEGRLLGINTNRVGDGFYLAIPADGALRKRVDALARDETPERPRLGVAIAPAHVARRIQRAVGLPERDGLLVRGVEEGSPAARAGLAEGDLIVQAGGRTVGSVDDLQDVLIGATGTLELGVVRGGDERSVKVDLKAPKG